MMTVRQPFMGSPNDRNASTNTTNGSSAQSNAPSSGGSVDNLLAVVLKDLESRIADWNAKVEAEKDLLQKEWQALHEEKQRVRNRTSALDESADDIAGALRELQRLREELEKRLAVTPMDLNAAQLQEEWRKIDKEKADLKKATEELQHAFERLADAQAALEMIQ